MVEFSTEEQNIITAYALEIDKCMTKDQINKLYRQARIWNRFHRFLGSGCTDEVYRELNTAFKEVRWNRLANLGYPVFRKEVK